MTNQNLAENESSYPEDLPGLHAAVKKFAEEKKAAHNKLQDYIKREDFTKKIFFPKEIFELKQDKLRLETELEFCRKRIRRQGDNPEY